MPRVSRETLPGERGLDLCSKYHVSMLHQDVRPRVRAKDPVATLPQVNARGWWKELPPVDPAHLHGAQVVLDLLPPVPDVAEPVAHRETLSADPWCECVALVRRFVKLQEACDAKANKGVAPGVDDRRALPGRGCRNGQHGRPRCRRAGRRSRTSCVISLRSVTSVAGIRHRLKHSAAATWFGTTLDTRNPRRWLRALPMESRLLCWNACSDLVHRGQEALAR